MYFDSVYRCAVAHGGFEAWENLKGSSGVGLRVTPLHARVGQKISNGISVCLGDTRLGQCSSDLGLTGISSCYLLYLHCSDITLCKNLMHRKIGGYCNTVIPNQFDDA